MADVIVGGAGLAGLNAARSLTAEGLEVVVLEARNRVGGRVWSRRLPGGDVAEMGGEWIAEAHRPAIALAAELGLDLVDTGMDFAHRDAVGGHVIDSAARRELEQRFAQLIRSLASEALAEMSAADLLDPLDDSGRPALEVLRSRLTGTAGVDLSLVAAAEIGEEFGIGESKRYVRVAGGNDLLATEMARDLDVRMGHQITAVEWDRDRIRFETARGDHEAASRGRGGTSSGAAPVDVSSPFAAAGRGSTCFRPYGSGRQGLRRHRR